MPQRPGDPKSDLTYDPPGPESLDRTLERNIRALCERRERNRKAATWDEKLAATIGDFTGRMLFVYLHLAIFGFWIAANLGFIPGVPRWDESFVVLAMVASVEAIFLTTFVLITQNRMTEAQREQAELDLQISLLTEHEITKLAKVLHAIARKLDAGADSGRELEEVQRHVGPDAVLDKMEQEARR